jgi:hypothetical protein
MPIEDIDFLYQNSTKENMVLFVDSSKRNKTLYPTPAEFQIEFSEPFHFVYGIEILDTTIPRTMFMIETNNNLFYFKRGFRTMNEFEESKIELIIQDFSSADSFFQRIRAQFDFDESKFDMDNYENIYDNTMYLERGKSDYPVIRFVNDEPFLFDMSSKSTAFNIFGFDQFPKEGDSYKYSTTTKVFNSFVNINTIPLTDTIPFKYTPNISISSVHSVSRLEPHGTLSTITFEYTHKCDYNMGSFLQYLHISSNKTQTIIDNYIAMISLHDTTYIESRVFDNLESTIMNNVLDDILFEGIIFENSPNTELLLKPNHTYKITMRNVFVHDSDKDDLKINIVLGYSYFVNMRNLPDSNKIFVCKPIYSLSSTDNDLVDISNVAKVTSTTLESMSSVTFTIQESMRQLLQENNTGTVYKFEIELVYDVTSAISKDDIFILRLTRKDMNTSSVVQNTKHLGEVILTFRSDIEAKKSFLTFNYESIDTGVFNYINIDLPLERSSDEYTADVLTSLECQLINKSPHVLEIYDGDDENNINYYMQYLLFKNFSMISPGMLNLASENYLILRCDEIENHLRGSYDVKDFSPGLGLLNIDVQGYASGRTEFFSIQYKEFHPIGKLNKMKFRFERKSDGLLYDFKNIDLHFIMTIKFLRPSQKNVFDKSSLNPNYNPNYMGYFNKTLQDLYDEESSDDDSDTDQSYFDTEFNDRENNLNHQFKKQY